MSRFQERQVSHRTPGPAVGAPDDGLEGSYSAIVHLAPSGGECPVIVEALDAQRYQTAFCPSVFTPLAGDSVMVTFDELKRAWITSWR